MHHARCEQVATKVVTMHAWILIFGSSYIHNKQKVAIITMDANSSLVCFYCDTLKNYTKSQNKFGNITPAIV